jgi:DNA repair protein RadD
MITPREIDQMVSINATRSHIAQDIRRILIQAPCGFGKTVVGAYIAWQASLRGNPVIFLVHREELAKQASRTFTAFGVDHGLVMAGITYNPTQRVQVGMIDTVRNRIQKDKLPLRPAIVLVDECHHAVSKGWKMVIDHFHSMGAVIIGLSATPQRLSGEALSDVFDVMVPGPSVRDLIDRGSLCDYAYYAPPSLLEIEDVHTKYGDFSTSELAAATDKPTITGDAIKHYQSLLPGKRAIIFAVNINHSKHVVEQFCAAGIPAAHVDGEMDRSERTRIVQAFEAGEILVMSNVSLFGEGFDVKACDGVILLRATQSLALHIQMVGRAMRPHETKDKAIIIDHVGNVGRHGLPDEDHEWSLEGKKKKRGKKKDVEEIKIKQCPMCYRCHPPAPTCLYCGHIYEVARSGPVQVDGTLQEITQEMRDAMRRDQRQEQGRAKTVDELMAATGMSRFRAQAIVKAREEKSALHDGLVADLRAWSATTGEFPGPTFGASFGEIRKMKPKELKELRARFDAHRAARTGSGQSFFELEGV